MILEQIAEDTKIRVAEQRKKIPLGLLKKEAYKRNTETGFPFEQALKKEGLSFICEVKKASPSKGVIAEDFPYLSIARAYEDAGADAVSCLTEPKYFLGSDQYLREIAEEISIPVLRKDFVVEEYQIYEAKVIGADAILLIAAVLDTETMFKFRKLAESLGLECLFEAHNKEEIEKILKCEPKVIGINNRNLKTFEVSLENTANFAEFVPKECVLVSESGISDNNDMKYLKRCGADAVLIGETLMRSGNVEKTIKELRNGI